MARQSELGLRSTESGRATYHVARTNGTAATVISFDSSRVSYHCRKYSIIPIESSKYDKCFNIELFGSIHYTTIHGLVLSEVFNEHMSTECTTLVSALW